ncbi:MAG: ABC transporter substrate-binding protein, partial [Xanthobacteraceae bacterium]
SNVLDQKIDAQLAAGKLEVDAAILQTAADYVRWKKEGRLIAFKPPGFDKMEANFKDADGTFWATMVNVVPYMFNSENVAAADIPNSAMDFLKPQFQGKIVTAYPADDDVTLWVFYHIVQKYGWAYMDKYMAAKPNFIQGHLGEQRSIGSGQNLATFDSILDITSELKRQGQPVDSHIPTGDALPIWPLSGAIFKGAPHPNAAKLFISCSSPNSRRSCRPGRRAPTYRRRPATSRFCPIKSPTIIAFSSPTNRKWRSCASASKAIAGPS